MRREFTGRHMAGVLVGGFAVVLAVNLYMATMATRGFSGVVVENSYVASQHFNSWLAEARREDALGWSADAVRAADGRLAVHTRGVPAGAQVQAIARRPLGAPDTRHLTLTARGDGTFRSTDPIPAGRWTVRVAIAADGQNWARERALP